MAAIQFNTSDWSKQNGATQSGKASRGLRAGAAPLPSGFPSDFLTPESEIAEEFVAQSRTVARGQVEPPGALDFSYDLGSGEAAILAIRHPSGALTFHLPVASASRGLRQSERVRFVVTVRSTDVSSGRRGIAAKVVKAILIKVGKGAADKAVSFFLPKLAAAFERSTWADHGRSEGWLQVTKDTLAKKSLQPAKPTSTERSLLFIHGTFSNTASAYDALNGSSFFDRVQAIYGDRIFGFDHFTVSRTPEENARMLLEGLPNHTTTFDVVTHSRGGLVLRNLVERSQVFGPLARRFKLGRAVLVASPNEGTPLATPLRWAETVGWMANLLELFPENPFTTGAAFVANGLVWIARHASGDLPGLHSMDGGGEMIAELQSSSGPPQGAYSALVSNYSPAAEVWLRMVDTGIDQFFASANDLVVPSEGGWRVARPGKVFIPGERIGCYGPGGNLPGDLVTHVNFFTQSATVDFVARALLGEQQPLRPVQPLALLPDRRLLREGPAALAATAAPFVPPVVNRPPGRHMQQAARTVPRSVDAGKQGQPPLRISVINGDLTFEKGPLLLGHYRARRLTGTEKVMNDLVGGTMKLSLDLGLYPLAPGTHQIFLNTRSNPESPQRIPRPKAVIVVGLGQEGKLNAAELVETVRQAVIAWAQRVTEHDKRPAASQELSATLMGSGGSGVTAGQAAQRIAQGVYEANQLLSQDHGRGSKSWPRVSHLRLVEIYLDRASDAWRALRLQAAATPDRYAITEEVKTGTGWLSRSLDSGYRGADYDYITAEAAREADGRPSIRYTLDTKRARSEVRAQRTQGQLLRDLVATASDADYRDPHIGRTLFNLLVPVEIEAYLAGSGEMQIELDKETAGIPWELLDNNDGDQRDPNRRPWALRTQLLRKLRTDDFRLQVVDSDADASFLVVGEPECPQAYPRLEGARAEAEAVYNCLKGLDGVDQENAGRLFSDHPSRLGPDARTVFNALLERPWRIVHVAGHGEPLAPDGSPGGVVLSNGAFLGASEIASVRHVPELVFINCCHLAARSLDQLPGADSRKGYNRVQFASGVAEELIKIGVRCVIAAGWAVDDTVALTFATRFYTALGRGNRFIAAVSEAREAAYSRDNNTWAAYQCYGDPDWIFCPKLVEADAASAATVDEFAGIGSEAALKLALETIVVETKFQHALPLQQLKRVRSLEQRFAAQWGANGAVAELFAVAYVQTRDLDTAIEWYERALSAVDAKASLNAADELANVRVRRAWNLVEKALNVRAQAEKGPSAIKGGNPSADRKAVVAAKRSLREAERALQAALIAARQSIKEATSLLEKLLAVHASTERESLYGSAYKRLAMVEAAAGRPMEERKAIEGMKLHYQRALTLSAKKKASNNFYPLSNYLAAELALNAGRRGWKGLDAAMVRATNESFDAKSLDEPDFWSVVGPIELQMYKALAGGKLASSSATLQKAYQDLHRRVSASWMWSSVYDTARFVLPKYTTRAGPKEGKAAETLLARLAALAQPK